LSNVATNFLKWQIQPARWPLVRWQLVRWQLVRWLLVRWLLAFEAPLPVWPVAKVAGLTSTEPGQTARACLDAGQLAQSATPLC